MEGLSGLLQGLAVAMQPMNLMFAAIGVFLGTAVGVLRIGPALNVALLLPVTTHSIRRALIMFAGIYMAAVWRLDDGDPANSR